MARRHFSPLIIFVLSPLLALGFQEQAKRPFAPEEELKVIQGRTSLVVSGQTFSYAFRRNNGLIGEVKVLGRDMGGGVPIPDLAVAEKFDPESSPYAARHETEARVDLISADPARVRIRSEGAYVAEGGKRFPLRYSIDYEVFIDGVVIISVENTAVDACSFRWLVLSAGGIRSEMAKFLNWMPDQSASQSTHYRFRPLSDPKESKLLGGVWIPWFWVGDESAGLEVTTWDVDSQTYSRVDNSARTDEPEMFVMTRASGAVRWVNYLVRRTRIFAGPGWKRSGQFVLAVTPSKRFNPYFAMLKGAHLGPHQHMARLDLPDEQKIRTLAKNGYNLVAGMANWRSGEYVPLNEADLRRTIDLCHKQGIKIIPYVTLMDLSHATETFRRHGEEWAIEPTTEFCHLPRPDLGLELAYGNDPDLETTLMCPGAEGWRSHWKKQIDRIIRDYEFDGIYFDFWYGRLACENERHGCGGRFRRATVLGAREMLTYAYNRLKERNPRAIIKANTNTLATALITSLVDIRLVGESTDAASMDRFSRQWLYTSYRLGEPTEFLWDQTRWDAARKDAFAALVNFLPQYYHRPRFEPRSGFDHFDVYRSFDDGTGTWRLGISGAKKLKAARPGLSINEVEREGAILATLINTEGSPIPAEVRVDPTSLAYEPLPDRLLALKGATIGLTVAAGEQRHVLVLARPKEPRLLAALGARVPAEQEYEPNRRVLRFSIDAPEGALVRYTIYTPAPPRRLTRAGETLNYDWAPQSRLIRFTAIHKPGERFELEFGPS